MRISDRSSDVCSSDLCDQFRWRQEVRRHDQDLAPRRRDRRHHHETQLVEILVRSIGDDATACAAGVKRQRFVDTDLFARGKIPVFCEHVSHLSDDRAAQFKMQINGPPAVVRIIDKMARADIHATGKSDARSEEHTSELQSLMRISYAGFCLKNKNTN